MFVKFKSLSFSNLLSYGNKQTIINFEKGLNLLSGKNAQGKCLDPLTKITIQIEDVRMKKVEIEITIKDLYNIFKNNPELKNKIKIDTRFGFKNIVECDITAKNSKVIKVETESGKIIKGSPDHLLLSNNCKWVKIKNLMSGKNILFSKEKVESIKRITTLEERYDLYDLQVEEVKEFYANGIVSHNSSFLDALAFCIYGQPYRKIKIKDLINRKNEKKLYTKLDFEINDNLYSIERTLSPSKLKVYKNNESLESLSTKKMTQLEIDKIVGVNYNLFRQIISLAINYNKPFLSLGVSEKRDIVESIFDIKIFSEMLKLIRKENTGLKHQTEINQKTLELLESNIKSLSKQIKDITKAEKDFEENKTIDKKNHKQKIKELKKDIVISEKRLKEHQKLCLVNVDRLPIHKKDRDKINKTLNKFEYSLKTLYTNKKLFSENETCPLCKSELTKIHRDDELLKISKEISKLENDTLEYNNLLKTCKEKISSLENEINTQNKSIIIVATEESKIDFLQKSIDSLKINIEDVDKRVITFKLDDLKKARNEKAEEYTEIRNEYREHLDIVKTNDVVSNILSENGVKSYFFKRLIPLLNQKISKYLSQLDLPLQLSFDDTMQEQILNLGSSGYDIVSYFSLSEGEKKRVDMAILFSFIDITKTICNWNCNLIIMDELLDSSIDDVGLDKLMINIKNMIYNNKMDMSIYIISHRLLESDLFKNIYEVKKTNGFSKINKIEV